ncbi:MAG: helix-turn-helix domain-containing protein [Treponema sp.]|nr:helix-turn-helix domain-containing protein [Treponema sp.]
MDIKDSVLTVDLKDNIETLKALASKPRAKLLSLIKYEPLNINEISEKLNLPQSTVATNIAILESAGIIKTECTKATKGLQKICTLDIKEVRIKI